MSDAVNHPSHYNSGKIEVAEAIEDWSLGFHLGNVVKYVARAGRKDPSKEIEDLKKAGWYLSRKIELLEAEKMGREPKRPNDMVRSGPLRIEFLTAWERFKFGDSFDVVDEDQIRFYFEIGEGLEKMRWVLPKSECGSLYITRNTEGRYERKR